MLRDKPEEKEKAIDNITYKTDKETGIRILKEILKLNK